MNGYAKPCGECRKAERYATTLRCTRDAPRNAAGDIPKSAVAGSPMCESQRLHGWLASRWFGACGREGRFFELRLDERIDEHGPTTFFLAVHEDMRGRVDVKAFADRAERDAFVERIGADDLIYSPVDVVGKPRSP